MNSGTSAHDARHFTRSLVQPFGGRRWLIEFAADPATLSGSQRRLPMFATVAGVVISVLLGGTGYALSSSRVRAVKLAERITHTLRDSEIARAEAQRIAHPVTGASVPMVRRSACRTRWPASSARAARCRWRR